MSIRADPHMTDLIWGHAACMAHQGKCYVRIVITCGVRGNLDVLLRYTTFVCMMSPNACWGCALASVVFTGCAAALMLLVGCTMTYLAVWPASKDRMQALLGVVCHHVILLMVPAWWKR
jgi:hypothetical protein